MYFVTDFSYATIGILCLLFIAYFTRRNTLQKSGTIFLFSLVTLFLITVVNHLCILTFNNAHKESQTLIEIFTALSMMLYTVFYFSSVAYSLSILHVNLISKKLRNTIFIIIGVCNLFILSSPITHVVFRYVDYEFVPTTLYSILYVIMITHYMFGQLYLIIRYGNNVKRHQKLALYGVVVFMFISFLVQIIGVRYQAGCLMGAITMIFQFSSIEDPSEYYYKYNLCFNEYAFRAVAEEKFMSYKVFSIGFIGIENFNQLSMYFNRNILSDIETSIIKRLGETFGSKNVFYLDNEIFAIIIDKEAENAVSVAYNKAKDVCNGISTDLPLEPYVSMIEYNEFKSKEDIYTAIEIFRKHKPENGKDKRFFMITEAEFAAYERENMILNAIKHALKNDNFLVYFQPIYDEEMDRFSSCEALLRLSDKELGMVYPGEFIPIAEKHGLIGEVGEKVFSLVCKALKKNNLKALGLVFIQINISASQCVGRRLANMLLETCAKYEISPETFNIEISESSCTTDKGMILDNILALKRRGMTFSIDNFGCVFSNADKITSFPVKYVKFDRETIWSSTDKTESKSILEHLVVMVKELGYRAVACGVETESLYRQLKALGFNYFQGFFFSKPIPENEYIQFLKEHNRL